jgi:hypothetical protein
MPENAQNNGNGQTGKIRAAVPVSCAESAGLVVGPAI